MVGFCWVAYNECLSPKNNLWLKITGGISALRTLGGWGVFILAAIDSSAIPIPLDALVAGYVFSSPARAWLYCIAGAAGSALGSLVPFYLGRAGGELFLLKRIDEAKLKRIRDRFERQEFLALMIPAMLPPPTPFKLFVFSAGVFEMKLALFMAAVAVGRLIRFAVLALLTVIFGPGIVTKARTLIRQHPSLMIAIVAGVLILVYVLFRLLRPAAKEIADEIEEQSQPPQNRDSGQA